MNCVDKVPDAKCEGPYESAAVKRRVRLDPGETLPLKRSGESRQGVSHSHMRNSIQFQIQRGSHRQGDERSSHPRPSHALFSRSSKGFEVLAVA